MSGHLRGASPKGASPKGTSPKGTTGHLRGTSPKGTSPAGGQLASVDARVKIGLLLLVTVLMFALGGWVPIAAGLAGLIACIRLARMDPRAIARSLRPVAVILAFTLLANLISLDGHAPVPVAGPFGLDPAGGLRGAAAVCRIVILLGYSLAVSASTTPPEVCDACVRLMRPLGRVGVPVGDVGMVVSIALRFIPVVAEEFRRIRTAQRARGAWFDGGGAVARVRAHAAILTPLAVGLFRRADRLAESMAARLYDGRVSVPPRRLAARDRAALAIGLACCAAVIAASCLVR